MAELTPLVKDLALILVVAGMVTIVFKKLKQPLVLGYIVAGFLVSPHMPYTMSVTDSEDIKVWADIGVMFTLFSLGLDFSFKKIFKMGAAPFIATITIVFCMMSLGMLVGHLFGWTKMNCIFLGGMLAMSSTTIIYKAFDDLGLRQQKFAGLVMSVLILEDILAIVMMVMLAAISGGGEGGDTMLMSILKLGFFLVLWFVVGIFIIPLILRSARRFTNAETLLIVSLGLCCLMAVVSTTAGFSSAFGAFVMGSILAETIEAEKIIKVVEPVKNLFGAIFFVSVGMLVQPHIIVEYAIPILVLVVTILLGQAFFGSMGFLFSGQSLKSAMRCGFSMAQIGEFSFIIATMGLSLHVIEGFLYPVVVAVSVITTFLTPYMMKAALPAYDILERHLPKTWVRRLNHLTMSQSTTKVEDKKWKSLLSQLAVFTVVYSILSAATISIMFTIVTPFIRRMIPLASAADAVCAVLTILFVSPFLRAIMMKKNHSEEFKALWTENRLNRMPLVFTIIIRIAIALAFVFIVCKKFTNFSNAILICLGMAVVLFVIMSRAIKHRSIKLERLFIMNLRSRDIEARVHGRRRPLFEGKLLDRDIHIADFDVPLESLWAGRTLKELALGSKYGVHVSSILRAGRRLNIPDGESVVFPGDKLQVIGSDEQLGVFGMALAKEIDEGDDELEKREMKLRRLVVDGSSKLLGKTMEESGIRQVFNCMVVGLEEGLENLSQVSPQYKFEKGDIVWVVGEEDDLNRLTQE